MAPGKLANQLRLFLLALVVLGVARAARSDVVLVRDGKAAASIVTSDQPTDAEQFAAERLRYYLGEMTGAQLAVVKETAAPATGARVYVGNTKATAPALKALRARQAPPEASLITVAGATVTLAGTDDAGTTHAVYCLLEGLGCRWYFPARWGWVIPRARTVAIPAGERYQAPDFKIRAGIGSPSARADSDPDWQVNEWARANHLGGWSWWGAGHSYQYLVDFKQFDQHPEWFAYYDGARHPTQLCTTNPEVRRMALQVVLDVLAKPGAPELICISPCDGAGFCECENCRKLIPDDGQGGKLTHDYADRIVEFANFIADNIRDRHPGHYVTYYCDYHSVGTPRLVTPAKNSVFWITQWAQDQLHPVTPATRLRQSLQNWGKNGNPIFLYTYWGSYGSFTYWPAATTIGADVPYFHDKGAVGVYSETHQSWGGQHLNFILFSRLLWDSQTNPRQFIAEICDKAYGPAAPPMRRYYQILEDAAAAGPAQYHLHSEITAIFPPPVRARLRQCLDTARTALQGPDVDPACRQRLAFVAAGYQVAELYYGISDLKTGFGVTKDPALRGTIMARYRALLGLITRPEYQDRLVENWMFEPGLRQELASVESGTVFGPGRFSYEDGFERGGKTALDARKLSGFSGGTWGLDLPPGGTGLVLYEFGARDGVFDSAQLTQFVTGNRGRSLVQVSTASAEGPWQEVVNSQSPDAATVPPVATPVDLGPAVKGRARFWLQVTLTNQLAADAVCGFDLMRLEGEVEGGGEARQ
jgi:hypothetical protein